MDIISSCKAKCHVIYHSQFMRMYRVMLTNWPLLHSTIYECTKKKIQFAISMKIVNDQKDAEQKFIRPCFLGNSIGHINGIPYNFLFFSWIHTLFLYCFQDVCACEYAILSQWLLVFNGFSLITTISTVLRHSRRLQNINLMISVFRLHSQ